MPGALSVSTGVWVGVGARDEPDALSGVSHFLEHLLFKGTADRSAKSIAEAVDRVGGDMNAFTSKEVTAYYTRLPASKWQLAVELLGAVLSEPALRNDDVEIEREVILEELGMDEDAHDDKAMTVLAQSLFPDHPLGRETAGERATVEAITPDDVRSFFNQWYRPSNMVVAFAGAVDHEEAVAEVQRQFTSSSVGQAPVRHAPTNPARSLAVVRRKSEQAHLAVGLPGLSRDAGEREAIDIASYVLGGGPSSRLFDEVREKRGLAYSIYAGHASYSDTGALTVYAGTSPAHLGEVLGLVSREIDTMAANGITNDELDIARGYLAGSYVLGLEDSASRMSRLAGHVLARGRVRPVDEQIARYEAVTSADVAAVCRQVLGAKRSLTVVGPVTKAAVRKLIA